MPEYEIATKCRRNSCFVWMFVYIFPYINVNGKFLNSDMENMKLCSNCAIIDNESNNKIIIYYLEKKMFTFLRYLNHCFAPVFASLSMNNRYVFSQYVLQFKLQFWGQ